MFVWDFDSSKSRRWSFIVLKYKAINRFTAFVMSYFLCEGSQTTLNKNLYREFINFPFQKLCSLNVIYIYIYIYKIMDDARIFYILLCDGKTKVWKFWRQLLCFSFVYIILSTPFLIKKTKKQKQKGPRYSLRPSSSMYRLKNYKMLKILNK